VQLQVNNHEVYVATGNRLPDPARETVAFIHGTGQDHTIWVLPTRYFARHGKNVLALDLPGHGRSEGPPLESIEEMADWVVAALDAAGLSQAALVGHSMGSLITIAAAARHPDRVRAISLVSTSVPMPVNDFLLKSARENKKIAIDILNFWGFSKSAQLGGNATPGNWMLGGGMRLMEKAKPGVIFNDLNACNNYIEGLDHAGRVQCPAQLILGDRDRLTPTRASKAVSQALPEAMVSVLPGAGHALLSERPDPVLDELIKIV
jgi:pimeloyl-ACP methyl ester carboxylesterase